MGETGLLGGRDHFEAVKAAKADETDELIAAHWKSDHGRKMEENTAPREGRGAAEP
jgi:hypothetical protein